MLHFMAKFKANEICTSFEFYVKIDSCTWMLYKSAWKVELCVHCFNRVCGDLLVRLSLKKIIILSWVWKYKYVSFFIFCIYHMKVQCFITRSLLCIKWTISLHTHLQYPDDHWWHNNDFIRVFADLLNHRYSRTLSNIERLEFGLLKGKRCQGKEAILWTLAQLPESDQSSHNSSTPPLKFSANNPATLQHSPQSASYVSTLQVLRSTKILLLNFPK